MQMHRSGEHQTYISVDFPLPDNNQSLLPKQSDQITITSLL